MQHLPLPESSLIYQTLHTTYLFTGLNELQIDKLQAHMCSLQLAEKEYLFTQEQPATQFFILLEGYIKLSRLSIEGTEKVIEIISPGQSFAEAIMFLSKRTYPVTAQAITPSNVLSFENSAFLEILKESFDTCLRVMSTMSQRLHQWLQEIDNLTLKNATFRLVNYLLYHVPDGVHESYSIDFPVPKQVIASRLSITPETLSRILLQLSKEGLISVTGRVIHIHHLDKLRLWL